MRAGPHLRPQIRSCPRSKSLTRSGWCLGWLRWWWLPCGSGPWSWPYWHLCTSSPASLRITCWRPPEWKPQRLGCWTAQQQWECWARFRSIRSLLSRSWYWVSDRVISCVLLRSSWGSWFNWSRTLSVLGRGCSSRRSTPRSSGRLRKLSFGLLDARLECCSADWWAISSFKPGRLGLWRWRKQSLVRPWPGFVLWSRIGRLARLAFRFWCERSWLFSLVRSIPQFWWPSQKSCFAWWWSQASPLSASDEGTQCDFARLRHWLRFSQVF